MASNRKNPAPLQFAMVDRLHILMPGLFRSMKRGTVGDRVHIVYDYGDSKVEVKAYEQLSVFDLTLLHAVISLAGPGQVTLSSSPSGEKGKELRKLLELKMDAEQEQCVVVEASMRRLAHEMGQKYCGAFAQRVERTIERFMLTGFFIESKKQRKRFGFNVLSYVKSDRKEESLVIGLNPFLASAVLGGSFALVSMDEVRKIRNDAARLLHTRLSGFIDPGGTRTIRYDTLCRYVWPDKPTPATARQQARRIKGVVDELTKADWMVEHKEDKVTLTRPMRKYRMPSVQLSLLDI